MTLRPVSYTHLDVYKRQVVCLCSHAPWVRIQILYVLIHRHGKGMVLCYKALFFCAVLQQRELRDPQHIQLIMVDQPKLFAQMQAQMAQRDVYKRQV